MESKKLLMFLGIFALVLSLSLVSATNCLNLTEVSVPSEVYTNDGTLIVTFELSNRGTCSADKDLNWSITSDKDDYGTWDLSGLPDSVDMGDLDTNPQELSATFTFNDTITLGEMTTTIHVDDGKTDIDEFDLELSPITVLGPTTPPQTEKPFCKYGINGTLEIKDFDVDNLDGDDDEWEPLDEIEIQVEVENTGNDKVEHVIVQIMILNEDGEDVTDDFDLDDEEVDLGNIKEDKKDTASFKIDKLPADLEDGTYKIYIKAYSEDDENLHCIDTSRDFNTDDKLYHEISIVKDEDNAIILRDFDLGLLQAKAGEFVEVRFDIYNIGTEDEDDVLVTLYNKDLGIDEGIHVRNMDVGDRKEVIFNVKVPNNAEAKRHTLRIDTYFDYDDGDVLDKFSYDKNSFEDLDKSYKVYLDIEAEVIATEPTITATLLSDAEVGKELVVQVSVTNKGEATNFVIAPVGYESWAKLVDVQPQILTIAEDETAQATIKFTPTKAGTQTFNIQTIYNGQTKEQSVSVTITEQAGFLTGAFAGVGNTTLYIIAAIVLILIIVIITLIVKIAAAPVVAEF